MLKNTTRQYYLFLPAISSCPKKKKIQKALSQQHQVQEFKHLIEVRETLWYRSNVLVTKLVVKN